jgi:alkylhydroperoxidase/carboxymuconolactone decarboxylase family protein YurZ
MSVSSSVTRPCSLMRPFLTRSRGRHLVRAGLEVDTCRLLVLAMTAALWRWEEFRLHLRAGLAAGLEWADVGEGLLQTGVYAGLPAANTAFAIASELRDA